MQQGYLKIKPTGASLVRQLNFQIKMEPYVLLPQDNKNLQRMYAKMETSPHNGLKNLWQEKKAQLILSDLKFRIYLQNNFMIVRCSQCYEMYLCRRRVPISVINSQQQGQRNAGVLKVDVIFIPDQNQQTYPPLQPGFNPQPVVYPQQTQPTYPQNYQVLAQGQDNPQLIQIIYRPLCYLCHGSGVYMKKGKKKQCFECAVAMGLCKKCFGTRITRRKKRCTLCKGH